MEVVSKEEFDALIAECDKRKAEREEKMPDEKAALDQMFEAYQRLQEMGWSDAIYCPKDSRMFSAISAGSTGIHKCNYMGEWPKGSWWIYDGDMWPAHPMLWRERKDTDPDVDYGLAMDYKCGCCES